MKFVNVNEEYEKFPELKNCRDEVLKIQEWVEKQPHLPNLEEREVIVFFHTCQYHTEITKQTIDLHFTTKTHCPEFFSNMDPATAEIQQAMKTGLLVFLKKQTPQGRRVFIGRLSDCDARKYNFVDQVKLNFLCLELILAEEEITTGYEFILDLSGLTLGHVARIGIMAVKKFMFFIQEASAVRICGVHYINLVPFMDKVLALIKPFLKEELLDILHFHTNFDSLYKHIPKDILPVDYDGNGESLEVLKEQFYKKLMDNREYFLKEEATRRVNEKLRPGKPKSASDLFGAEGNFRQLEID